MGDFPQLVNDPKIAEEGAWLWFRYEKSLVFGLDQKYKRGRRAEFAIDGSFSSRTKSRGKNKKARLPARTSSNHKTA